MVITAVLMIGIYYVCDELLSLTDLLLRGSEVGVYPDDGMASKFSFFLIFDRLSGYVFVYLSIYHFLC